MSAAFSPATRQRGVWNRRFRPDSEACRRAILDQWYTLCARQARGDRTGVNISAAVLHDNGVFYARAKRREAGAA